MDLYEVPLSMGYGLWDGDYVSQLPYVWYLVLCSSHSAVGKRVGLGNFERAG